MLQCKTFFNRVLKQDGSGDVIENGDSADLVLKDQTVTTVEVTAVSRGGKRICWELTTGEPRSSDVRSVDGNHFKSCADYDNKHDGPEDSGTLDPVLSIG